MAAPDLDSQGPEPAPSHRGAGIVTRGCERGNEGDESGECVPSHQEQVIVTGDAREDEGGGRRPVPPIVSG